MQIMSLCMTQFTFIEKIAEVQGDGKLIRHNLKQMVM
jgi:hypothetical protein